VTANGLVDHKRWLSVFGTLRSHMPKLIASVQCFEFHFGLNRFRLPDHQFRDRVSAKKTVRVNNILTT